MTREKIENTSKINIFVRDITNIMHIQQESSDRKYQDAMEANYSHEQMTPLNCILNNAKMLLVKLQKTMKKGEKKSSQHYKELMEFQVACLEMNKQIMFSAQILQFYNTNQIEKMKIKKGELVVKEMCSDKPEQFIE